MMSMFWNDDRWHNLYCQAGFVRDARATLHKGDFNREDRSNHGPTT